MRRRRARPIPVLALALAAGLTAACASTADPLVPGPDRARVQLGDVEVRAIAQLLRYEDQRTYDADVFHRLAGEAEEVRRRTAVAAGRIGDIAAVPLLARLLDDDPNPAVRADAAFALGQLGDTSRVVIASLREAAPGGWVAAGRAETTVVVEIVHALGKLGSAPARAMVLDALRTLHGESGEDARRVAAEALLAAWRFGPGPDRVDAVARYLAAPDPGLRWRAAYALMRMGEPDAALRLLEVSGDADHRTRAYAARGLAAARVDSADARDAAVAALTAALRDPHRHVRILAVRALGGYGPDAPADAMAALLRDPDPHTAIAAAEALAGRSDARDPLVALLHDARAPHAVRAAAARALGDDDTVAAALGGWLDGPFEARYAAARALSALGWRRAEPLLRPLAEDRDVRVTVAALVAAAELGADPDVSPAASDAVRRLLTRVATDGPRRPAIVARRGLEPLMDSLELADIPYPSEAGDDRLGEAHAGEAASRTQAFYEEMVRTYVAGPLAGERRPRAVIRTAAGEIVVELLAEEAPLTVDNFVRLAGAGFWDDGVWHRVVPNFVLQDGAPAGDPLGGPGWAIRDEINRVRYARGVLGMALSGPDTGGSQWFITHSPQHHLDGGYTVFGRVVDGMAAADAVLQGDPIRSIRIR